MKRVPAALAFLFVFGVASAHAQQMASAHAQQKASTSPNTTLVAINNVYNTAKGYLLATAEQVPAEKYSFKPTPEVRSLGAILGHIADSSKMFCALASGKEQPENMGSEKLTDKAALVAALKDGFAYCDGIYAKMTDADLMRPVKLFGQQTTVAQVVALNAAHDFEHYGNLVTYMRINGMVPPSSQR